MLLTKTIDALGKQIVVFYGRWQRVLSEQSGTAYRDAGRKQACYRIPMKKLSYQRRMFLLRRIRA